MFSVLGNQLGERAPEAREGRRRAGRESDGNRFDIVVTLVTQGPAAAWDKIKEQLTT